MPKPRINLTQTSASIEPELPACLASDGDAAPVADNPPDRELRRLLAIDALHAARDATAPAIPAARFESTDIPRLDQRERLAPVATVDKLIATCARAIEAEGNTLDHDGVLDGLCRLCDHRPGDFGALTAPLLKRARQLLLSLYQSEYGISAPFVDGGRRGYRRDR